MIRHITYCSENMTISAQKCSESALKFGCDTSTIYTYEDLNKFFRLVTTAILLCERGAGYWVWKPQIIQQEMNKGEDGDVIIYTDAGVEFVNDVHHLINAMDQDVMVFGGQYNHREWCKGDVLKHTDIKQLQASCILVNFLYGYNKVVDIWQENTMNKQQKSRIGQTRCPTGETTTCGRWEHLATETYGTWRRTGKETERRARRCEAARFPHGETGVGYTTRTMRELCATSDHDRRMGGVVCLTSTRQTAIADRPRAQRIEEGLNRSERDNSTGCESSERGEGMASGG